VLISLRQHSTPTPTLPRRTKYKSIRQGRERITPPPAKRGEIGRGYKVITMNNTLYFGDNLDILRKHIADESSDG